MDAVFWYLDAQRERHGPYESADIAGLIANGTIVRDTPVWDSSLNDWRPAASLAEFSALFGNGAHQPSPPVTPPAKDGPLKPEIPVWGLFWRELLQGLGYVLIIPAPWVVPLLNRFLCSCIALPGGARLYFSGKAGDIWYILAGAGFLTVAGRFHHLYALTIPVGLILQTYIMRWFCSKLKASDGSMNVTFEGHLLGFLGWSFLVVLAFFTIIGWAWVLKARMQWMCRSVQGTHRFDYTASGLDLLWRYPVLIVSCLFIIPIPWAIRWFTAWSISKVSVVS